MLPVTATPGLVVLQRDWEVLLLHVLSLLSDGADAANTMQNAARIKVLMLTVGMVFQLEFQAVCC